MAKRISAARLTDALRSGGEIAVLDAREQGVFSAEHLFWGSCLPLSTLELGLARLVPRRDTSVVWVDADGATGGLADLAAQRSAEFGWTDVAVLEGGMRGWPGERYSGVNVPSKAFGEWVEKQEHTPHLSATELARRQSEGENLVVLDSRPMREYRRMSIPQGIDCPGAELVYRVHEIAPDPDTVVVVNCAGRTRSIIGAQSLRNAGIPNPVYALEHGTMGWELAGLTLAHGETTHAPKPSEAALQRARTAADRVAARFRIEMVSQADVEGWLNEDTRNTFVFDVRSPEEYEAGHLAVARHAPGGQLVQATDEYVGVLGARIVLIDDGSLIRATMTASWLVQLGRYEVAVARMSGEMVPGAEPDLTLAQPDQWVEAADIDAVELAETINAVTIIDLADSLRYRRAHIPGAWWAVRSRLDEVAVDPDRPVVLTSPDGRTARLAWAAANQRWPGTRVLLGGTAAWTAANGPVQSGLTQPTTETNDVWYKPYDSENLAVVRQHMQDYLTWEVALLDQIAGDELVSFRTF